MNSGRVTTKGKRIGISIICQGDKTSTAKVRAGRHTRQPFPNQVGEKSSTANVSAQPSRAGAKSQHVSPIFNVELPRTP